MPNDDNLNPHVRDVYRVLLEHPPNIQVSLVPGSVSPVHISLSLRASASLERALTMPAQGAILGMDMTRDDALRLVEAIQKIIQTKDSLQQAEFLTPEGTQKSVPNGPRPGRTNKK